MAHLMAQKSSELVRVGNVTLIGSVRYRIEFAVLVKRVIDAESPDCICIEMPQALQSYVSEGVNRLPCHSVVIHESETQETSALIIEGSDGVIEAARSALETSTPLWCVDPTPPHHPFFVDPLPDAYFVDLLGQKAFFGSPLALPLKKTGPHETEREVFMASRIQDAAKTHKKVVFVGGFAHVPGIARLLETPQPLPLLNTGIRAAILAPLHPEALKKGFAEIPKITETFEEWRSDPLQDAPPNRHELILWLMDSAIAHYEKQTRQELPDYARATWAKFLRKWLAFQGRHLPNLYQLVSAARSAMDEDFAYHVHEYLCDYSWTNDPSDPAAVDLNEDHLLFHGHRIVLHKKLRTLFGTRPRHRMKAVAPAKWKEHLKTKWENVDPSEVDICSYPPEDIAVERWGETLMKHATHLLQASRTGAEPFVADMCGGPDVRETLRHFHEDRIYVKVDEPSGCGFGSVVVVFDEDESAERYPFQMTWLGEHSQESDMAFYSTMPGKDVVGPGIARLEYGGFVMSYPPLRMYDIWNDNNFDFVHKRHERLLVAGIAYSEKPGIVYAAKKPPPKSSKRLAVSMGKRIVYVPLGSLNPTQVRRMRTFHMLQNKGIRNWAQDYLKRT